MATITVSVILYYFASCIFVKETLGLVSGKSDFVQKSCESNLLMCFKMDMILWTDKLIENYGNFTILPGISLLTSSSADDEEDLQLLSRDFPEDAEQKLDSIFLKKISKFLRNHYIGLNLWNITQAVSEEVTARAKDKKGDNGSGMMLVAGAMVLAMLGALALSGIALIAGKALLAGVVAFMLSSIVGIKSLTSHNEHKPVGAVGQF